MRWRRRRGSGDKPLTSTSTVFTIGTAYQRGRRMGSADKAVRLLLEEDAAQAASLAQEIQQMNVERQTVEQDILRQVEQQLLAHPAWLTSGCW